MRTIPPATATTLPPAKLNLFLELLGRRPDGYHEIDTVMVAIDLCDRLTISRSATAGIRLTCDWLPSRSAVASRLGLDPDSPQAGDLLDIPTDQCNLISRALSQFIRRFDISGGFDVSLGKRIPAGAGMGGASSDAASALRCAAKLTEMDPDDPALVEIAAAIGSDVPFFFGCPPVSLASGRGGELARGTAAAADPILSREVAVGTACRARGRGELLEPLAMARPLHFVVVFPGESLSTARVYGAATVNHRPSAATALIQALASGDPSAVAHGLRNRLAAPARKIAPWIDQALEFLRQSDVLGYQLTGSGSACFGLTASAQAAIEARDFLRRKLEPGALVMTARTIAVPAPID